MNIKKALQNFNELVVFKHTVFAMPFLFISMLVAAHGWFGLKALVLGVLAAFFARNFAMAFNRLVDAKFDIQNPRTASRPSVDGRLNKTQMHLFVWLNALFFVLTSFFINSLALWLSLPFLVVLGFYSFVKRFSYLCHVFLGLALGLAPIAGSIIVANDVFLWTIFLSLGVLFWVGGFDLFYSLDDLDFDKSRGLFSVPSYFGAAKTLVFARVFHSFTIIFWFLFWFFAQLGFLAFLGVLISLLVLAWENYVVHKSLSNINKAFFTANGYLGMIFLFFIILDLIWN